MTPTHDAMRYMKYVYLTLLTASTTTHGSQLFLILHLLILFPLSLPQSVPLPFFHPLLPPAVKVHTRTDREDDKCRKEDKVLARRGDGRVLLLIAFIVVVQFRLRGRKVRVFVRDDSILDFNFLCRCLLGFVDNIRAFWLIRVDLLRKTKTNRR